jgi:hypothetical protein
MNIIKKTFGIAACIGMLAASATSVFAFGPVLTIDESGNAYLTASEPFAFTNALEPISAMSTLQYTLPFAGVAGDVLVQEQGGSAISDILRFDGNFHVYFFSDYAAGSTEPADVGLPSVFMTPNVTVTEYGTEDVSVDAWYTPIAGQPGYKPAAPGMQYHIISDVPEPGTMLLGGLGGGLLLLLTSRRRAGRA